MKVLHILKSEPDAQIDKLLEAFSEDEVTTVPLYDGEVDWAALVDDIFENDKVICWW